MTISDEVILEMAKRVPRGSVITRCDCDEIDTEWKGGEHLVSTVPGTHEVRIHFYPDEITHQIVILHIEGKA